MPYTVLQILMLLVVPFIAKRLTHSLKIAHWLSPVVLCYAVGIAIANLHLFPLNKAVSTTFSEVSILFAIPLLLYATNIPQWLKQARPTILSFGLCVLSVIVVTSCLTLVFQERLDNIWQYSGMMTGLFTGGAPNMQAVGLMLEADEEAIVLVNAADIFCGGIYLVFLTSIAHAFFGLFLPSYTVQQEIVENDTVAAPKFRDYLRGFAITVGVIAAALGITYLTTGAIKSTVLIILLLTTLSIALSFNPSIRRLKGTFEMGDYCLLIFCVAIGLLADFSSVLQNGGIVILYMASVWLSIVSLHALLGYFFKIDRDTLMITSTAAIYGPPFVGQVASAINNRQLLFSGMATGLIGYALGNYLGVGMAYLLKQWLEHG